VSPRPWRLITALAITAAATACTAGNQTTTDSGPKAEAPQTIEVWHGWSAPHEVKAFEDAIAGFHKLHPNITVKLVKGQDDTKILNAIRSGTPPDVVSSFSTNNVGQFCSSGALQNLTPYLQKDKINLSIFPKAVQDYTQYKGNRCTLPLLADDYALYSNKALMKGNPPPKTISELTALAKKLTVRNPDGTIKVAGFLPSVTYYEHVPEHVATTSFGGQYLNPQGRANFATDPAFTKYLQWEKSLLDWYGYANVKKFVHSMGQEFEASNPFEKGKVAMGIDGEWRTKFMEEEAPKVQYDTSPVPVNDDRQNTYGGGFVTGTIIGIPRGAKHAQASWEFVKYLTTNTDALVTFANGLGNVPSTIPALASPNLKLPAQFKTFLDVFKNPNSTTIPSTINGGDFVVKFQSFVQDQWEPGKVPDLQKGLQGLDKKVNDSLQLAGG
jgi:ABC-type glycerol-3-phosphate transport system substrate-binding protein